MRGLQKMNMVEKIREKASKNPFLASIKHFVISPFLGFIYIPYGKKGFIFYPRYRLLLNSYYTGVWTVLEVFRDNQYNKILKLEKGDVVVDIGAHIGTFTVKALREVGEKGRLIAIEPDTLNLELLRKNTEKYKNVEIVDKAVGEKPGVGKLYISETTLGHSLDSAYLSEFENIDIKDLKFKQVKVETLDNILSKIDIPKIDFVKIDVEGAELNVLKGAKDYLKKINKIAIAAYHHHGQHMEIEKFLLSNGFKIKKLKREGWFVYGWRE